MDDNFDDYFMTDNEANEPAPHVETPQEREDREIEESTIRRRHNSLRIVLLALIVLRERITPGMWLGILCFLVGSGFAILPGVIEGCKKSKESETKTAAG